MSDAVCIFDGSEYDIFAYMGIIGMLKLDLFLIWNNTEIPGKYLHFDSISSRVFYLKLNGFRR